MDNGNQRLFVSEDCAINGEREDLPKATFPQNTINSVTSSIAGLQHTVTDSTPPKITSALNKGKCVIKPIAFKPLSRRFNDCDGQQYGSTPTLTRPSFHIPHYGSSSDLLRQTSHNYVPVERKLRSASPIAMSSLPFSVNRKLRSGYDSLDNINLRKTPPTYSFKDSSTYSKSSFRSIERVAASEGSGSMLDLASSPCESSSFAEMEAALRERDYELSYLRQTMEHNEQVIFKVYQEKEHAYERELRKIKALHDSRLRAAAQKSLKLEQMLMIQTYQLQEEKKRLKEENSDAVGEISALREEIDALRLRLEETEWKLCQKSDELNRLKTQIDEDDHSNKGEEISTLKNEIRQLKSSVLEKDNEIDTLKEQLTKTGITDKTVQSEIFNLLWQLENEVTSEEQKYNKADSEKINEEEKENAINLIDKIKLKISNVIKKWHEERNSWEQERSTWVTEKEKVLCYQKQLQLSYIEMFRRNKTLEAEIENLAIELHLNNNSKSHRKKSLQNITHAAIQL
ncbi:leucine zipper putative tumor suppressor 2 homolog isoform X2 [Planococcus citri]|uniref:leucine zipper putative tumor suppressor 2 homolog isoform X2 n=1 Tax=Planococcus citri TaxID=170843 RepID=UPI0031F728C9